MLENQSAAEHLFETIVYVCMYACMYIHTHTRTHTHGVYVGGGVLEWGDPPGTAPPARTIPTPSPLAPPFAGQNIRRHGGGLAGCGAHLWRSFLVRSSLQSIGAMAGHGAAWRCF